MFQAIKRWLSNRRLDRIYSDERFRDEMPSLTVDWNETIYFDLSLDGERIAYHTPSMRIIDIESIHIPNGKQIHWNDRSQPRYDDKNYVPVIAITNFLKMKGTAFWDAVPFACIDGKIYYITRDSIKPRYVVLINSRQKELRIPKTIIHAFTNEMLLKPNIYTMHPVEYHNGIPMKGWQQIIEMRPSSQDVNGAYTALTEVPDCPGVLDLQSNDIIIHINALDNSASPIVDLLPFLKAIRDGFKHTTKRWALDIGQIQLQIGMNPKPTRVADLDKELPGHRIILSDTPNIWSEETYINKTNLPTSYP